MAVAGKVAITLSTENGGAWSADVTYDRLVAVKHNNNLYISRKTVANVEPPNNEFWFLALEGFGGEDVEALIDRLNELGDLIQAIIDGTTKVGNAKTLDGHEAEYFAKKEELTKRGLSYNSISSKSELENLLNDFSANIADDVFYEFEVNTGNYDYPLNNGTYYINGIKINSLYEIQTAKRYLSDRVEVRRRSKYNGTWSNWIADSTVLDLANYLPLSGDIPLPRNVNVGSTTTNHVVWMGFLNTVRNLSWQLLTDGTFRLSDNTNGNAPIVFGANGTNTFNGTATNANNLFGKYGSEVGILHNPNYGGVEYAYNVSMDEPGLFPNINNANSVLTLNRHAGEYTSQMGFSSNGRLYYRIFDAEAMNSSKPWREILDTGNKPSGSYTGNGSATSRTISTGGLGSLIYIFCPNNATQCIIGYYGGVEFASANINSTEATFRDGVLTEATTHGALNVSGYTYYYQVL